MSGAYRLAHAKFHLVERAVAADAEPQPLGERIDHRYADPVETTGDLVRVIVELAPGVQLGHDDFGARPALRVVRLDLGRYAAAVVDDADRIVGMNRERDLVAVTGKRLVDRVVDDLEHQWCKPVPSLVSPIYIPGRLRTASSPLRTLMLLAS